MFIKRLKAMIILLIFLLLLCATGTFLSSAFAFPFTSEAVFAQNTISLKKPTLSLSALPFSLAESTPQATFIPETTASPSPTASPPATYETYPQEPWGTGDTLQIKNSAGYPIDTEALLNAPFPLSDASPKVLLMHTHTSEAYAQSEAYSYVPSDAFRTEDANFNICNVGKAFAQALEQEGISVLHDTTSHDYPSYSGCYNRSLATIERNLAEHPSIEIVIDLHRDAISDANGNYLKTAVEIDSKTAAQALVVIGTDAGGLPHPDWQKNLSLGLKVQKTICTLYPGLARPLHLRTERFNGHVSTGALLIEIGSNANTMEEALYCAELTGSALGKTLRTLMT